MSLGKVAVLGAGTMGSGIAALFTSVGIPVVVMDQTEEMARAGAGPLAEPLSFDAGLPTLHSADWVIEAVSENFPLKAEIWAKASSMVRPGTILSTNTSGLSIEKLASTLSGDSSRQFLGIHFFNPPAKLKLVEVIRTSRTDSAIADEAIRFVMDHLGKVVVEARDTPNFIANRIGAFFSVAAQSLALEGGWTVEEVDVMTGPELGMPKSGTYRLMDVIGLDIWRNVLATSRFQAPAYFDEMLQRGWLGAKTGSGFYRKREGALEALNLQTLTYHPVTNPTPDAKRRADFIRSLIERLVHYCHDVAPEIANSPSDVDLAMKHGYGWTHGPFEIEAAVL